MNLKVISLNLWEGGNLFDGIVNFLRAEDADILMLQEVYNGSGEALETKYRSLQELEKLLNYDHVDFAPSFIDNRAEGRIPQGNAVFSKFPITSSETTFFNKPFDENYIEKPENFPHISRNLQHVVLNSPAGEINLFNFQGVWDLNGDNYSEERQNMSRVIIDEMDSQTNVILAGDTNAKPGNQAIVDIEEHVTSVFGDSVSSTFNMRRKNNPGYATAAVDMMFVSPDFEIQSREVRDIDISDHLPLIVNMSFKNV